MKRVAEAEAKERLDEILNEAQREPLVIYRQERDIAVVLSLGEYERLRTASVQAFLDLRNQVAAEAALNGFSEPLLADLLRNDEA
jgi:antitoxin Phd